MSLDTITVTPEFRRYGLIADPVSDYRVFRLPYAHGVLKSTQDVEPSRLAGIVKRHSMVFDIPFEAQVQANFLRRNGFKDIKRLRGDYDNGTLIELIEEMTDRSNENTLLAYFINLDSDGRLVSIKKTTNGFDPEDRKYVVSPHELRSVISRNKGVNFVYLGSCFGDELFGELLPSRTVLIYAASKGEMSFHLNPFWAFFGAYDALSNHFKQPVDFSEFDFKVPKESMDAESQARASWPGIKFDPRIDPYANFSVVPFDKRQIRKLIGTNQKMGRQIDIFQTNQHMGIKYNVRLKL